MIKYALIDKDRNIVAKYNSWNTQTFLRTLKPLGHTPTLSTIPTTPEILVYGEYSILPCNENRPALDVDQEYSDPSYRVNTKSVTITYTAIDKSADQLAAEARQIVLNTLASLDTEVTVRRVLADRNGELANEGNDMLGGVGWMDRQNGLLEAERAKL